MLKTEPNKVTAVLKVVVTGEFYDDEATEETLRYYVEQYLEDAGFDVDVALLKEQDAMHVVRCKDCVKYEQETGLCKNGVVHGYAETWFCADGEHKSTQSNTKNNALDVR